MFGWNDLFQVFDISPPFVGTTFDGAPVAVVAQTTGTGCTALRTLKRTDHILMQRSNCLC